MYVGRGKVMYVILFKRRGWGWYAGPSPPLQSDRVTHPFLPDWVTLPHPFSQEGPWMEKGPDRKDKPPSPSRRTVENGLVEGPSKTNWRQERDPLLVRIFCFYSVFGKQLVKTKGWCHCHWGCRPLLEILDPPLHGNKYVHTDKKCYLLVIFCDILPAAITTNAAQILDRQ